MTGLCATARTLVIVSAMQMFSAAAPRAEEACTYAGTGDYAARIAITTIASRKGADERIRVLWRLTARALLIFRIEYWVEEVSEWRDGTLRTVGLNIRYLVNGRIVKQQWDVFDRSADGFSAYRIQAKTPEKLAEGHGGFGAKWDPSTFGAAWLDDYRSASPERRPDLDLRPGEAPADLAPPFAEAFYRVREAPARQQRVALFLPGNKKQRRADVDVAAPTEEPDGGHVWRVPLESRKLGIDKGSIGLATVSPSNLLTTIRFSLSSGLYAAQGEIRLGSCAGSAEDGG